MPDNIQQKVEEIALLLMWLTSWKNENIYEEYLEPKERPLRSTKEYPFGILDKLKTQKMIAGAYKSKYLILTNKGIKEAKKLEEKYLPDLPAANEQSEIDDKVNFDSAYDENLGMANLQALYIFSLIPFYQAFCILLFVFSS